MTFCQYPPMPRGKVIREISLHLSMDKQDLES